MKNKKYFELTQTGGTADLTIYGDITSWPWLESDVSAYNLSKQLGEIDAEDINVHLNSYGGEVAEGLAIYNVLRQHPAKVTTYCDGFACSIASVIFMAGDERIMADASLLMIHNPWTRASGNANDFKKQAEDLEVIGSASAKAYLDKISIGADELQELLDNETWITSEDACNMGFATGIYAEEEPDAPSQCVRKQVMEKLIGCYLAPVRMADVNLKISDEEIESMVAKTIDRLYKDCGQPKEENRLKKLFGAKAQEEE